MVAMVRVLRISASAKEKRLIRAAALLVQAALVLRWVTVGRLSRNATSGAGEESLFLPHAFPYPLPRWIFVAAVIALIAVWRFNGAGVVASSLFNILVVIFYGMWIYRSSASSHESRLSLLSSEFYLYRSTWWDIVALLLTIILLCWELSLIGRSWKVAHQ